VRIIVFRAPRRAPDPLPQLVLAYITSMEYPYIRLSGDFKTHSSNLIVAAILYAGTAVLSLGCIWAQRPARVPRTSPTGRARAHESD